ncbi:39S ribosomal protein L47, mitochondrial isoform X1 [Xenopus laevis]|nr:39S ribosomal protein L47, mitochondrial isoform X1 [Xenopus laevis]
MAASTVGRVLSGCKHLWAGQGVQWLRRPAGRTLCGYSSLIFSGLGRDPSERQLLQQCTSFHSSSVRNGLDEFFDDPKNWGEKSVKSGDAWTAKQLRGKSNEDLHKLWYVLLKEKNMLLTLEQESKRQRLPMPSPERLSKVGKAMRRLDTVITEREDSLRLLQTGQEKPIPGDWRKDCFGETTWYNYKEWPMPWFMNRGYKKKNFFSLPYVNHFIRLKLEKKLRSAARRNKAEKQKQLDLEGRFPRLANTSK